MQKSAILLMIILFNCSTKNSSNGQLVKDNLNETTKNAKTIKIEDNRGATVESNQMVDSVYYVRLETNEECLIGRIDKLYQLQDRIVIVDKAISRAIFIFDLQGKFLSKISRFGEGPEEYTQISDATVDKKGKQIFVLDEFRRQIKAYDFMGNYIQLYNTLAHIHNFEYMSDSRFVLFRDKNAKIENPLDLNYSIFVTSSKKPMIGAFAYIYNDIEDRHFTTSRKLYEQNGKIYYNAPFSKTIYEITEKNVELVYRLDLGRKGLDESQIDKYSDQELREKLSSDSFFFLHEFADTDSSSYMKFWTSSELLSSLYDKRTKKVVTFSKISTSHPEIIYFPLPVTGYKDFYISYLEPQSMISMQNDLAYFSKNKSEKVVDIYAKIKEGDNPIIMYYRFNKIIR
jgi:hypothetical protein